MKKKPAALVCSLCLASGLAVAIATVGGIRASQPSGSSSHAGAAATLMRLERNVPGGVAGLDKDGRITTPFNIEMFHNDPARPQPLQYGWSWDTPGTVNIPNAALAGNCWVPAMKSPMGLYCQQSVITTASYGGPISAASNLFAVRPANALDDGNGPRNMLAGINAGVIDETRQSSSRSGAINAAEFDIFADDEDDRNVRSVLALMAQPWTAGATMSANVGLFVGTGGKGNPFFHDHINMDGAFSEAALNMRYTGAMCDGSHSLTACPPAIQLADNEAIRFNTNKSRVAQISADPSGTMLVDSGGKFTAAFGGDGNVYLSNDLHLRTGQKILLSSGEDDASLSADREGGIAFRSRDAVTVLLDGTGNIRVHGSVIPSKGIVLPNLTTRQILSLPNPKTGTEVNDTDMMRPVIYENGHWYPLELGTALRP